MPTNMVHPHNRLLSLITYILLLFTTTHCQQILVLHINQSDSNYFNQSINNTLCIIPQNKTNPKSFSTYYILTNNIDYYLNIKNIPILFYHSIYFSDLPNSCLKQIQTQTQTQKNKNINYLQIPINSINHLHNKIFVQDPITLDPTCPTQTWEYFLWSLKQWYLIYIFVILLGMIIGSIMIIIIVFCCWKYKKKKFIQQIIDDYKNNRKQIRNSKKQKSNSHSSSSIDNKNKNKNKNKKHSQKYARIDINDSDNKRHYKSSHIIRNSPKRKDKKRRKTLPSNLDENNHSNINNLSAEENSLLQLGRMKSNSDPYRNNSRFGQNIKDKKYKKHHLKQSKSANTNANNKSSRSRSPWRDKDKSNNKSNNKYEQYKFTGNGLLHNNNNKRRHSGYKNKKRKRSKSPRIDNELLQKQKSQKHKSPRKDNNNGNISVIVNHIHHHNNNGYNNNYSLPKLPPPIPQPIAMELTTTKKSIGIDLAQMKDKMYENKQREIRSSNTSVELQNLPNLPNIPNEGDENINDKNIIIHMDLDEYKGKGHRYMASLTNVNDEGIGVFDNIISDTKMNQLNDNDEESSSFTQKSGDVTVMSGNKSMENVCKLNGKDNNHNDIVDKNGNLSVPTKSETKRYKLPKKITKGQWL